MANRPVFIPVLEGLPGVLAQTVSFAWHAGLSKQQKQKNVAAIHEALKKAFPNLVRPLEISSKSRTATGVALSAFNLGITSVKSGGFVCVESLYQASKVFADAGPFPELYLRPAKEVRERLAAFKDQVLVAFDLHGVRWPLLPRQVFYTWVYCQALYRNPRLAEAVKGYDCFTDVEFNPERSVNCQAYAAAFYVSLARNGSLEEALSSQERFLRIQTDGPTASTNRKRPDSKRTGDKPKKLRRTQRRDVSSQDLPALPLLEVIYPSPGEQDV